MSIQAREPIPTVEVDGEALAIEALYGADRPILIRAIGHVVREAGGAADQAHGNLSEIRLLPGMERFMAGLEEETALVILWHLDRALPVRTRFPRGWDGKEVGPFASRTPHRLTPIGVTEVELLEVRGTTLVVRGLDAFDGTPVLDIKVSFESLRRAARGS